MHGVVDGIYSSEWWKLLTQTNLFERKPGKSVEYSLL